MFDEIELCAQNIGTILGLIVNTIGMVYVIAGRDEESLL